VPPHAFTDFFADDGHVARDTLSRLHRFHLARPDVEIVPTHCPEAYARLVEPPA
jgi:hypothetical protein